jgi:hypothetical protein
MLSKSLQCMFLLLFALAVGVGLPLTSNAGPNLSEGQKKVEQWMSQEATNKVKPFNFNQIKNVSSSLAKLRVIGVAVRLMPGGKRREYNWEVRFHVEGTGNKRQLVAEAPIIKG